MSFTFVLKDKGTPNQGWWLKVSNVDELSAYYESINPTRMGRVFENYMYGKEWNYAHPGHVNKNHAPHFAEASLTDAVVRYASQHHYTILEAIHGFQAMVATEQLECIREYGAIYINRNGGYHMRTSGDIEYAFVHRDKIIFPEYTKKEIKISKFPYGQHYYAHIGDLEVRDGDTIKWNTYEEAYRQAEKFLNR